MSLLPSRVSKQKDENIKKAVMLVCENEARPCNPKLWSLITDFERSQNSWYLFQVSSQLVAGGGGLKDPQNSSKEHCISLNSPSECFNVTTALLKSRFVVLDFQFETKLF